MKKYIELVERVLADGVYKSDRNGVGCYSVHGEMLKFNLQEGFPILTTKKMGIKNIAAELIWFLSGSTNNHDLNALNCHIWDDWALEDGSLGPIYGKQWRDFNGVDQIKDLIISLKVNPNSRRHIVTAWNPEVLPIEKKIKELSIEERLENVTFGDVTITEHFDSLNTEEDKHDFLDKYHVKRYEVLEKVTPQQNVELGNASLPACHTLFQMHTEKLTLDERINWLNTNMSLPIRQFLLGTLDDQSLSDDTIMDIFSDFHVPEYGLKCQVYLR